MGSLVATVNEDGTLQTQTTSGDSLSSSSSSSNSVVDSDTFLTLLIAEMQNQDPLEPTSNTEWVSQYATFTQVEQLSEMADSMDLLRANELVGKDVIMKVTSSSTGDVTYARGVVEYVTVENGSAILVIDGNKYSLSDLDSVISDDYSEAYDLYTEFVANIDSLPDVKYADTSYADKITQLYEQYNFEMSDYQKNFMVTYASSELDTLVNWVSALKNLGIEFRTEKASETSLDDILESFNSNMSDIMSRLDLLTDQTASSGEGSSSESSSSESASSSSSTIDATSDSSDSSSSTSTTEAVANTDETQSSEQTTDTEVTDEAIAAIVSDNEAVSEENSGNSETSETTESTDTTNETTSESTEEV
jgi:flagellar basal-body rod modification protein FlgD